MKLACDVLLEIDECDQMDIWIRIERKEQNAFHSSKTQLL